MMDRFISLFCTLLFAQSLTAQQLLWSTLESTDSDYVPTSELKEKALDLYEIHDYYLDGTGFSKESFFKKLDGLGGSPESWNSLKDFIKGAEGLTAFAFKNNDGHGSLVMLVLFSPKGVDMVGFSNVFDVDGIHTSPYEKERFGKWFASLLQNHD